MAMERRLHEWGESLRKQMPMMQRLRIASATMLIGTRDRVPAGGEELWVELAWGSGSGRSNGLSVKRALPEVSSSSILWLPRMRSASSRLSSGTKRTLRLAGAPYFEELIVGEEDVGGVGEGGTEEHGGGAAIDEGNGSIDGLVEVEEDGGAVGLISVEDELAVGGDGVVSLRGAESFGEVLRGEHGAEANESDVRGDEEDGGGGRDG